VAKVKSVHFKANRTQMQVLTTSHASAWSITDAAAYSSIKNNKKLCHKVSIKRHLLR